MEKLTKVILNELNEWDLSCSEESTLKLELAKALTKVVKNCNLHAVNNLAEFCKNISQQEDCPAEFIDIVNKEFWNLI